MNDEHNCIRNSVGIDFECCDLDSLTPADEARLGELLDDAVRAVENDDLSALSGIIESIHFPVKDVFCKALYALIRVKDAGAETREYVKLLR